MKMCACKDLLTTPRATPRATPRDRRTHSRRLADWSLPLLCALLVIASLAACGQQPIASTSPSPTATSRATPTETPLPATPAVPGGWKVYRDPHGAFTINMPQSWSADVAIGDWLSPPDGPTPDYDTSLGDPPRYGDQVTISFGVVYHALRSAVPACAAPSGPAGSGTTTVTVAGVPATYLKVIRHEEWYLSVASNTFLLTWSWPGYAGDWPGILAGQPVYPDPATWHADQELAHLILASFRPAGAPTTPCP